MSGDLRCANCGGPTSAGTAVTAVGSCIHPCRTKAEKFARHPDGTYCSEQCRARGVRRNIATSRRCVVCAKRIRDAVRYTPGGGRGVGRPRQFCSDACANWLKAERSKAERELAKDVQPSDDDVEAALRRARGLLKAWQGRGSGAEPRTAPSPLAMQRLWERVAALEHRRAELAEARWNSVQEDERERRERSKTARLERQARTAAKDREWKDALL